jgi:hypothetical protein
MDDNVTSLDAYRIAELIVDHWSDGYSDNGAIWARSKKALDLVHQSVSPELWDEALVIAQRRWGQG